jgi:hypothetical protein
MKLEVVAEVYVEMILMQQVMLLRKLSGTEVTGGGGGGFAACVFTINTNHYNTIQAIWRAITFHN